MAELRIAALPGDGVGPEVTAVAIDVLGALTDRTGHDLRVEEYPVGWAAVRNGEPALPDRTLEACLAVDAVLLGAVGGPVAAGGPAAPARDPAEHPVSGLLRLRSELACYANLRPVRVSAGLLEYSALREEIVRGADIMIVRELAGGLYYGQPRGVSESADRAWNTLSYHADEVRRIARVAFEQARARRGRVTSVDKANVLEVSRLWRSVVEDVGGEYPDVELEHMLVDRAALELMIHPTRFDTVLTSNLFGDILSDEAAGLVGSLGPLGSASLGGITDLYEPVHGSAPDIAGAGTANPMGAIASTALMLRHTFGLATEAERLETALDRALDAGHRTADLVPRGGGAPVASAAPPLGTRAFGEAVIAEL
ncbi:MAG: 3-isopropylmalate dehydrogenase [Gemmatimonadota bacterium]